MRTDQTIAAWEDEGGALKPSKPVLLGTDNQIAWAEQIRTNVDAEFDRIAGALESVALRQTEPHRSETRVAIALLEEKRAGVMARSDAGYFIKNWQELRDQARSLITDDLRHKTARDNRMTTTESSDH
jgi:hypothetical protein